MTDHSHLLALMTILSHERERLANAKSDQERALRSVWVSQLEREIAAEEAFLGLEPIDRAMSDDELLAELLA